MYILVTIYKILKVKLILHAILEDGNF